MFNTRNEQKLKHFTLIFDDNKARSIGTVNITSLQINRSLDNSYVSGVLKFVDTHNLVEIIPLNKNNKIDIIAKCCLDIEYKETFVAIKTKVNSVGNKTNEVEIEFVDQDTYQFMCQTHTEVFVDKKPADIISDLLSEYMVSDKGVDYIENDYAKSLDYYTVQGNKPLIASLNQLAKKYNMKIYQTRDNICCKSYDNIIKDAKEFEQPYIFHHLNPFYLYQIKEFKVIKMGAGSSPLTTPKQKIFSVDITDLRQQFRLYSRDTMEKDQNTLTEKEIEYSPKDILERSVYKHIKTVEEDVRYTFANSFNESNMMEILIPGTFDSPDIGDKITIHRETNDRGESSKPDQNIAGYWLVKGVSYMFITQDLFMIKLLLVRSGYKDRI
jgi:hypothetical protein